MENIVFFPAAENVFYENVSQYEEVLLPIVSIKLSRLHPGFDDEYIHLIQFNEDPYEGEGAKYFTDDCKDRMISFEIRGGKYIFKTDLKFFDLGDDWKEWFDKTKTSYELLKENYRRNEVVFTERCFRFGGRPEWLQDDETPRDSDGTPMIFVAQFDTLYTFDDSCPKVIYLFYSPKQKTATQIYQCT